jgi:hypothetical protein
MEERGIAKIIPSIVSATMRTARSLHGSNL